MAKSNRLHPWFHGHVDDHHHKLALFILIRKLWWAVVWSQDSSSSIPHYFTVQKSYVLPSIWCGSFHSADLSPAHFAHFLKLQNCTICSFIWCFSKNLRQKCEIGLDCCVKSEFWFFSFRSWTHYIPTIIPYQKCGLELAFCNNLWNGLQIYFKHWDEFNTRKRILLKNLGHAGLSGTVYKYRCVLTLERLSWRQRRIE